MSRKRAHKGSDWLQVDTKKQNVVKLKGFTERRVCVRNVIYKNNIAFFSVSALGELVLCDPVLRNDVMLTCLQVNIPSETMFSFA